jgi:hypothetical protein
MFLFSVILSFASLTTVVGTPVEILRFAQDDMKNVASALQPNP